MWTREQHSAYERKRRGVIGSRARAVARYHAMCARVRTNPHYSHVEVRVSREDFVAWFMPQDYPGCSVDRVRREGHYELTNMEIIPWGENSVKDTRKHDDKGRPCSKCQVWKPFDQYAIDRAHGSGHSRTCFECKRAKDRADYAQKTGQIAA